MSEAYSLSEEDRARQSLLQDTEALIARGADHIPPQFASHLLARVLFEDLVHYKPSELASIATDAWAFIQNRAPGTPKLSIQTPSDARPGSALNTISVLSILNDDMPFLVDSVMAELSERGISAQLVAHPILVTERDAQAQLTSWHAASSDGAAKRESFIHLHLERMDDEAARGDLIAALEQVLADVRVTVQDWRQMLARVSYVLVDLKTNPPPLPEAEINEAAQFLEWMIANNFTLLGVREYVVTPGSFEMQPQYETGLGLLRNRDTHVLRRGHELVTITPEIKRFLKGPNPLIVMKSAVRSRVHRRVYMDYIGIKRYDASGQLAGEFRIVGLFTSTAYTLSTKTIPYLRRKVANVLKRSEIAPDSHLGKALVNVLENYPRDELFQIDEDTLFHFAMSIMQLDGRPRVRVLARADEFGRFVSVMVYVPRDRYDSAARNAIGEYLAKTFKGRVSAYYPFFPEGPNVRVHYIIGRRDGGETPSVSREVLESEVETIVRSWGDGFSEAMRQTHDSEKARDLLSRYRDAFSLSYRGVYAPETAVADLHIIEQLSASNPRGVAFYDAGGAEDIGLKIWNFDKPIALTERVPVLENMGFRVVDERTYEIAATIAGEAGVWFHDMTLQRKDDGKNEPAGALSDELRRKLEDCFLAVMRLDAENDGYNALVLGAGLEWRDVSLVRAISRYLRQVRVPFSQDYMWTTLTRHGDIARQIITLFKARFDPDASADMAARDVTQASISADIEAALKSVESLDEDRILRRFMNAVQSSIRTNYFQEPRAAADQRTISIKYDSRKIDALPLPRPLYEISVYAPRVEGIHLRFGKVARGGLRWSDRPQDFRTEVLGLVKAQQVKNAVIVPVGAKGGFVPKRLPKGGTRDAVQAEGTAAYRIFVQSLLDITDNVESAGIAPPPRTVRHDADDPYLVVAADKGTATFSDTANGIAQAHGFWLDDAFASGGSAGYDHKKMGITARGAWESVKRHFREMDINIATTQFRVAGVGDMSGDVFGNGLLRENTIKLVAAFDHRDIFIDPDPDPMVSLDERQRLFNLPRSSWQDYNKALISKGGGIYSRSLKSIDLSSEAQAALGFERASATPQEVMQAILKANVDLLFFGGIGTYIRATNESDLDAGDRANDPIRVTGADLRCKVIGEGANLGMTQRGRIEAARHGVRLNTDAIDNSAGVNTSDVEVNIKIATAIAMRDGRLTREARDVLLAGMTDDVAALVLRNNYQQTLALSLAQHRGMEDFGFQQRMMQALESRGLLDRAVEFLPDDMELGERRRRMQALTRPELAVLLAYAKLTLYADLLESQVPDDPYLAREIGRYFPAQLAEKFPDTLTQHRLRRDIIATQLANSIINRGGPSLIVRLADQTGATAATIASAFAAVRDSYSMTAMNTDIDMLDGKISGAVQLSLYRAVQDLLLDRLVWFIRHVELGTGLASIVAHYCDGVAAVDAALTDVLPRDIVQSRDATCSALQQNGVPHDIAWRIANLPILASAPDIVLVADRAGKSIADVTATYFAVHAFFQVAAIIQAARDIPVSDYFDRLALDRALDSISDAERQITASIIAQGTGAAAVEAWARQHGGQVDRIRTAIHEIAGTGLTISKLSVAASLLGDLARV
jgi:glutamate dehydrogenase